MRVILGILLTLVSAVSAAQDVANRDWEEIRVHLPKCVSLGTCTMVERVMAKLEVYDLFYQVNCGRAERTPRPQDLCDLTQDSERLFIVALDQIERLFARPKSAQAKKTTLLRWCLADRALREPQLTVETGVHSCLVELAAVFPGLFELEGWELQDDAKLAVKQRTHEEMGALWKLLRAVKEYPGETQNRSPDVRTK